MDDPQHWIECWMNNHTLTLSSEVNSIALRQQIFITFLPFRTYTGKEFNELIRKEVIVLNHQFEQALIGALSSKGILLLNVPRERRRWGAREHAAHKRARLVKH